MGSALVAVISTIRTWSAKNALAAEFCFFTHSSVTFRRKTMGTTTQNVRLAGTRSSITRSRHSPSEYFYLAMALLVATAVLYGFSFTVGERLIHPTVQRPWVVYVHAVVFTGWLALFLLQSALVRSRKVAWHKTLGYVGVGWGALIVVFGIATAVAMARFNAHVLHEQHVPVVIPLFDVICFSCTFGSAVYWRRKPEYHRRLMLAATCALTVAGFGRLFRHYGLDLPPYSAVDALILLGVLRDLIVDRRVHRVYTIVLPAFIAGQIPVVYIATHNPDWWQRILHVLIG